MKNLTNEDKVKVLKRAKIVLTEFKRHQDERELNHHEGICVHIQTALRELFDIDIFTDLVQRKFDMHLVKPKNTPFGYWWDWTKKSYLIRHKAINTLIKHFESK